MRILISGAGPAGLALANCLLDAGMAPVIVEKAPALRTAGYAVGLHLGGWEVAERLGLIDALKARAISIQQADYRDARGRKLFSYNYRHLSAACGERMLVILRDALQEVLVERLAGRVPIRYGTTVTALADEGEAVEVGFSDGSSEHFDLVVAADGYRSGVRELQFGPHSEFLKPLGYRSAAWRLPSSQAMDCDYAAFMDIDLQAGLYQVGDGTVSTLFCWRDEEISRVPAEERTARIASRFSHWPALVSDTFRNGVDWSDGFFDTICQVEVPQWSRGRVVLIGDAAHCMTFLSGQGTSTAVVGAYVLAAELASRPPAEALAAYEARLRPAATRLQKQSEKIGGHYVPRSRFGLAVQSWVIPALMRPPLVRLMARKMQASAPSLA